MEGTPVTGRREGSPTSGQRGATTPGGSSPLASDRETHTPPGSSPLAPGRRSSTHTPPGSSPLAPGRRLSTHSHESVGSGHQGSTQEGSIQLGRQGSDKEGSQGSRRRSVHGRPGKDRPPMLGRQGSDKSVSSRSRHASPPGRISPHAMEKSSTGAERSPRRGVSPGSRGVSPGRQAPKIQSPINTAGPQRKSFRRNKAREADVSETNDDGENFSRTNGQDRRNSFVDDLEPANMFGGTTDAGTVHESLVEAMDDDCHAAEPTKVSLTLAKYLKGLKPRDSNSAPGIVEDENVKKAVGWIIRAKDHLEFVRQLFCGCHLLFWGHSDCPPALQSKLSLNTFIVDAGRFVGLEIQSQNDFQNYGALELTVALGIAKKRPVRMETRDELAAPTPKSKGRRGSVAI